MTHLHGFSKPKVIIVGRTSLAVNERIH